MILVSFGAAWVNLGRAQLTSPVKTPKKVTAPKTPTKSPKTVPKSPSKTKVSASPKKTPVKAPSTPKTSPVKKQTAKRTPVKSPSKQSPKKSKVNEVHVHVHPRAPPPPMNVTKVVHHSSKGEKEIVYRSPSKVGKDGRITKAEKKVVHIHHHSREY